MKADSEKLKDTINKLIDNYNFRGPLHFTDFSNLSSIIKIGYLCSRELCYANNIEFFDVIDGKTILRTPSGVKGCVRFYYTAKNCEEIRKLNIPVYLLFKDEIIYNNPSIYSDGDADSYNTNFGTDYNFFTNQINWENIFDNSGINPFLEESVIKEMERRRKAELLINEPVSINNLKNIIFRCNADYKRACNLFGKNKMYLIEPNLFYHDKNYIIDYNIMFNKQYGGVSILHFSSNLPVKNDDRHEYRLYDLNDELIKVAKVSFLESNSTEFHIEIADLPFTPVRFKFWFYGILSIDEIIG